MGNINHIPHSFPNSINDLKFLKSKKTKHLKRITKRGFNCHFKFRWNLHSRPEHVYVIHYVTAVGSIEGLRHVIALGADVNQRTDSGLTPVHFAILYRNVHVLEELAEWGADTDERELGMGFTPLHYACQNRDFIGAKKLLTLSADTQIKDKNNKTPLDIAKDLNNRPLIKLLSNHCRKSVDTQHFSAFRKQVNMSLNQLSQKIGELGLEVGSVGVMPGGGSFYGYNNIELSSRQHSQLGPRSGSYASLTSVGTIQSLLESGIGTLDEEYTTIAASKGKYNQYKYPEAEKIQENFEELNFNLTHTTEIINKLFAKKFITLRFKEKLKQMYGSEKNEELLDYVMKSSNATFQIFLSGLQETGQTKLASLLQSHNDQKLQGAIPEPDKLLQRRHGTLPKTNGTLSGSVANGSSQRNVVEPFTSVISSGNNISFSRLVAPSLAHSLGSNMDTSYSHRGGLLTSGPMMMRNNDTLQNNLFGPLPLQRNHHTSYTSSHNDTLRSNASVQSTSLPLHRKHTISLSSNKSAPINSVFVQRNNMDSMETIVSRPSTSAQFKRSHNDTLDNSLSAQFISAPIQRSHNGVLASIPSSSEVLKRSLNDTLGSNVSVTTPSYPRSNNKTLDCNVSLPVISAHFQGNRNDTLDSNVSAPFTSLRYKRNHNDTLDSNVSAPVTLAHLRRSHDGTLGSNLSVPITALSLKTSHNNTLDSNVSVPILPAFERGRTNIIDSDKFIPSTLAPFQSHRDTSNESKQITSKHYQQNHNDTLCSTLSEPSTSLPYQRTLGNTLFSNISAEASSKQTGHTDNFRCDATVISTSLKSVTINQGVKSKLSNVNTFPNITSALPLKVSDDILNVSTYNTSNLSPTSNKTHNISDKTNNIMQEDMITSNANKASKLSSGTIIHDTRTEKNENTTISPSIGKFYDVTELSGDMKVLTNSRRPICFSDSNTNKGIQPDVQGPSTMHSVYV